MRMMWVVAVAALGGCGDNNSIKVCAESSGVACTWAGKPGVEGFNGDGLDKLETELYWTMDMSFSPDGTVWFIDWNNHLVRRVLLDGTVKTYVGWIDPIFPGDGVPGPAERSADGVLGTDVQLNHPTDLAIAPDGKILVMAWHNHKLRELDPLTGRVRILAGGGAGYAGDGATTMTALFKQPKGLELDAQGNMFILDQQNFRIRKIERGSNAMSLVAGNGMQGSEGDGGPALSAKLFFEAGSNPEPSGGLVLSGSKIYVSETLSNRIRVIDTATGMIDTLLGPEAGLAHPRDIELGPDGDLYIADTDNNVIRAVNVTTKAMRTVAGTGELGLDLEDGHPALQTKLARPFGIEFDPAGNLYICDTINSRIVKVTK